MLNIIKSQHKDANKVFKNFIIRNYENWINETDISNTTLSHNLFRKKIKPLIGEKPYITFDN